MRSLLTVLTAAAILAAGASAAALELQSARPVVLVEHVPQPAVMMQQGGMSLDQAVEQVRRQCNGRIVSAVTKVRRGRETHEIKCLTSDGTVRTFRIPGRRV